MRCMPAPHLLYLGCHQRQLPPSRDAAPAPHRDRTMPVVEAGEEREDDLEAAALLLNNKAQALLQMGAGEAAPGCWDAVLRCAAACTMLSAALPLAHCSPESL